MRIYSWVAGAAASAALAGCVAYPVYQPAPVARLTPQQSAALAQPLSEADRDRLARDNAQVQRDDQADAYAQSQAAAVLPYRYAYPVAPSYYDYGYYGYPGPYFGGFYPWYPGVSLSFGFRGGYRYHGGYHGGYRGGFRGGYRGRH